MFRVKGVPRSFVTTGEIRISIIESTDREGYPAARDTTLLLSSSPFFFFSFFTYAHNAKCKRSRYDLDRRDKMALHKPNVYYFHSRERIILDFALRCSRYFRYFALTISVLSKLWSILNNNISTYDLNYTLIFGNFCIFEISFQRSMIKVPSKRKKKSLIAFVPNLEWRHYERFPGRMVIMTTCINEQLGKTTREKARQRNASLQLSRRPREDRQESRPLEMFILSQIDWSGFSARLN